MKDLIVIGGSTAALEAARRSAGRVLEKNGAMRFLSLSDKEASDLCRELSADETLDVLPVSAGLSIASIRFMAFDMDGTLTENECIDEMAARFGRGEAVSAVTRAAMRGEITDFAETLKRRIALLKGEPAALVEEACRATRWQPGAEKLFAFCRAHGVETYIVSGGFPPFTGSALRHFGMTGAVGNEIVFENGALTGEVRGPGGGKILDADGKRRAVEVLCALKGCSLKDVLAAGDGANDAQMLAAAGIGVAYHAKAPAKAAANLAVNRAGLDAIALLFKEAWE
jgi:phosphoserine phosphatase